MHKTSVRCADEKLDTREPWRRGLDASERMSDASRHGGAGSVRRVDGQHAGISENVEGLSPLEVRVVVGRLPRPFTPATTRALARVVNRRELASQCQDALIPDVDIRSSGWSTRARWWGVVVCRTPHRGELRHAVTIEWPAIADQLAQLRGHT